MIPKPTSVSTKFATPPMSGEDGPFVAGDIADRGPLERGAATSVAETRAREARELERQKAWRDQASKALTALKAEEGTAPVNADELDEEPDRNLPLGIEEDERGEPVLVPGGAPLPTLRILPQGISRKRLSSASTPRESSMAPSICSTPTPSPENRASTRASPPVQ